MAWASCYSPDFRVASIVGAAAGTTADNDRRLVDGLSGTNSIVADTIDTGRYVIRLNPSAATAHVDLSVHVASSRYAGMLFRFRLSQASIGSNCPIVAFIASTSTESILVRIATSGEVQYSFNNASSYTGSGTFVSAQTVYRFEVFVDWGTGTTHTLKVRLDGVEIINVTGGAAAVTLVDPVRFGANGSSASITAMDYADLVTYNDPAEYGTMDDWRVLGVEPLSDGTHSFTANDFQNAASTNLTTATTTSWQSVDDAPTAAPSTTDHIKQVVTRTTGYMEWVLRIIPSTDYDDPVLVCLAAALHPVAAATANSVAFRLNSGGQVSTEAAIDTSIASNTLEYRKHHYNTRPDGAAWVIGDVTTALRARFGYSGDASPPPACDAIMAFVVVPRRQRITLGQASETDTANVLTPSLVSSGQTVALGQAVGTNAAQAFKAVKVAHLGQATSGGYVPTSNDIVATSFETESALTDIFTGGANAALAFSTANPRTGARHVRATLTGNADSPINFPASLRQFTARFSIYLSALPGGTSRLFTVDGSSPVSRLSITTGGNIQTFIGGTGGTAAATLVPNTLYVIDVSFDMTTTPYVWKLRVNGGTTQTQSLAGTAADIADLDFFSTITGTFNVDLDDLHITKQASDFPLADMVAGGGDSAMPLTAPNGAQAKQASETDSAQAFTRGAAGHTLGQATGANTANALKPIKRATVNQVTGAQTANALKPLHRRTTAQATETDTANAFAHAKRGTLNQVTGAQTANALRPQHAVALNRATETDGFAGIKQAIPVHRLTLGQALVTNTANALRVVHPRTLAQATETDTAQTTLAKRTHALAQATETDTAQAFTHSKRGVLHQVTETDTANSLKPIHVSTTAQVTETDTANAFTHAKRGVLGQTALTNTAQLLKPVHTRLTGQALSTHIAFPFTGRKTAALNRALETDTANFLQGSTTHGLAQPVENDVAQHFTVVKRLAIGQPSTTEIASNLRATRTATAHTSLESDTANTLRAHKAFTGATETSAAQPITHRRQAQANLSTDSSTAQPFRAIKRTSIGQATSTSSALTTRVQKSRVLVAANENSTAQAFSHVNIIHLGVAQSTEHAQFMLLAGAPVFPTPSGGRIGGPVGFSDVQGTGPHGTTDSDDLVGVTGARTPDRGIRRARS